MGNEAAVLPDYVGHVMNKTLIWIDQASATELNLFAQRYDDMPIRQVTANDGALIRAYTARAFMVDPRFKITPDLKSQPVREEAPQAPVTTVEAEVKESLGKWSITVVWNQLLGNGGFATQSFTQVHDYSVQQQFFHMQMMDGEVVVIPFTTNVRYYIVHKNQ